MDFVTLMFVSVRVSALTHGAENLVWVYLLRSQMSFTGPSMSSGLFDHLFPFTPCCNEWICFTEQFSSALDAEIHQTVLYDLAKFFECYMLESASYLFLSLYDRWANS